MENIEEILIFILMLGAVFALLQIILFFKIWGMTNNIAKIKSILDEWLEIEHPIIKDNDEVSKK